MTLPVPTLSRKEAARYLGVCVDTVDKLRAGHQIRAVQVGGRVLYLRTILDEFLLNALDPKTLGRKRLKKPARRRSSRPRTTE